MSYLTRTSRILVIAVALLVAALAVSLLTAGGSDAARSARVKAKIRKAKVVKTSPPRSMYWGAWVGTGLTGTAAPYDFSAVSAFQNLVGKPLSLLEWSLPFADCKRSPCVPFQFPTQHMNQVRQYGAIPFLSWGSSSLSNNPDATAQPDYQLRDVTNGNHDTTIRNFAIGARDWGHPLFIRFNWEMNGNWFPWAEGVNGNQEGDFVPAWRRVHDIFENVGADNVTWVWCPYVDPFHKQPINGVYPGDEYVDWTCLDGYNWGPGSPANPLPWRTFQTLYRDTYYQVTTRIAPSKPMIFAEVATSDYGGDKGQWIRQMFGRLLRSYRQVRGLIYFDVNDRNAHWELESSPAGTSAFAAGIGHPRFLGNGFSGISTSPIPPP